MATIKFLIQSNSDNAPIYLRVSLSKSKSIKRKTGLYINSKNWSKSKGLPKQNDSFSKNLKFDLLDLKNHVLKKINEANTNAEELDGNWLFEVIETFFKRILPKDEKKYISNIIEEIINNAHTRENGKGGIGLSKSRINSYNRLSELTKEFESNKRENITKVNKKYFENFKNWLLIDKKYSTTYSLKKLSDLKTVLKEARSMGLKTSDDLNDIKTKRVSAYDDDMGVIILNEEELKKIKNLNLTKKNLINARKWLILACYTGQRGLSLTTRIKEENFEPYQNGYIIKIKQKKGNKSVIIPVSPEVERIFKEGMPSQVSLPKLNKYFKKIGEKAGINNLVLGRLTEVDESGNKRGIKKLRPKYKYISTHIGRRSFASNFYGKLPTPLIMKVTGHSNESTFLGYINQTDDSHLETFFNYFNNQKNRETY